MGRMIKKCIVSVGVILLLLLVIAEYMNKPVVKPENQYDLVERLDQDKASTIETEAEASEIKAVASEKKSVTVEEDSEAASTVSAVPEQLYSENAILIRPENQRVLLQKNEEERIFPASLTKIMTVIVAIENLPDLTEEIELSATMYWSLYEAGASMAGFEPEEEVRAIDLLYGAMLPSGAECCVGLADQIAGSEQEFVAKMNQKAADLGMDHTLFKNVTGLHDENHYTTVKDMSILLSYALQNSIFREVFTSSSYSTLPTNIHPDGITFYSTMFEKLKSYGQNRNVKLLGGKTGYTDEAGLCLASLAQVGDQEYILITAGAKGNHATEQYNLTDALAVYNTLGKQMQIVDN